MNGRILVIEDDQELRNIIKEFLSSKHLEVHLAGSSEDGLSTLRAVRPHLVLLDLHLPDRDGIETLKLIRAADATAGVLIMTGFDDPAAGRTALELGASDYIKKPIDFKYLEATITQKINSMISLKD